jgi:hypothetical protein
LQETVGDIYNADETGLFFDLQPGKTFTFLGDFCHGGKKSKQWVIVLLTCNADGSNKLPHKSTFFQEFQETAYKIWS